MGDSAEDAWATVWCLRPYHPYRVFGELNPEFERATDGRLLNFKEGKHDAVAVEIEAFADAISNLTLPRPTVIGVIPGHLAKPSNAGTPLARVAEALADRDKRLGLAVDLVTRTKDITKLASGGNRSIAVHLDSMRISPNVRLSGATVVLIDDVATTGNSIEAARRLLRAKGARQIAGIALCQTV